MVVLEQVVAGEGTTILTTTEAPMINSEMELGGGPVSGCATSGETAIS